MVTEHFIKEYMELLKKVEKLVDKLKKVEKLVDKLNKCKVGWLVVENK